MLLFLALASAQVADATGADKDVDAQSEKVVCRNMGNTGSRVKAERVCKTKAQWEELNARNRKGATDLTDFQREQRLSGK